ncbi:MAG: DUF4926 domain-containing protein [Desulfobacterales bacterium]|nr:DUF4926 domain-containing protein [Desulfobacterales bacterium]
MKLHDVIKVKNDIPEENLKKGMTGVIVTVFHEPCLAYEVEFCDENGETLIETALLPEQIESVSRMEKTFPEERSEHTAFAA